MRLINFMVRNRNATQKVSLGSIRKFSYGTLCWFLRNEGDNLCRVPCCKCTHYLNQKSPVKGSDLAPFDSKTIWPWKKIENSLKSNSVSFTVDHQSSLENFICKWFARTFSFSVHLSLPFDAERSTSVCRLNFTQTLALTCVSDVNSAETLRAKFNEPSIPLPVCDVSSDFRS